MDEVLEGGKLEIGSSRILLGFCPAGMSETIISQLESTLTMLKSFVGDV